MAMRNSAWKSKLIFEDIQDLISEKLRIRDIGETSCFGSAFNLETRDREQETNSDQGISKSKKRYKQIQILTKIRMLELWQG